MHAVRTRRVRHVGRRFSRLVRHAPFLQQHLPDALRHSLVSREGKDNPGVGRSFIRLNGTGKRGKQLRQTPT